MAIVRPGQMAFPICTVTAPRPVEERSAMDTSWGLEHDTMQPADLPLALTSGLDEIPAVRGDGISAKLPYRCDFAELS